MADFGPRQTLECVAQRVGYRLKLTLCEDHGLLHSYPNFVGSVRGLKEYWCTLFHETGGHATGHPKRLNRDSIKDVAPFGSPTYSVEECIAEMTAAYLCGIACIENRTIRQFRCVYCWMADQEPPRRPQAYRSRRRHGAARVRLRSQTYLLF